MDERMRFVVEYGLQELSMAALCAKYGISRKTGYKWLARAQALGLDQLREFTRAPHHHPNQISPEVELAVLALRAAHPSWGPKKLRWQAAQEDSETCWPARSTIAQLLHRHGLVFPRKRIRRAVPSEQPLRHANGPNAVWCIDFKGWFRMGDGRRCDPLTISDAFSRYLIRCQAVADTSGAGIRPLLEAAFREHGLPWAIRSDNGSPFASCGAGGLTRLSVWWIKLGILPERIEPGQPQQNGRHERMHLTLKRETCSPPARNGRAQQRRFDAFRREYNHQRPHEALDMETPASWYQDSPRPYPAREPELTYPDSWKCRMVRSNGEVKFNGLFFLSEALCGEPVGFEPIDGRYWRVHFGPVTLGFFDEHQHRLLEPRELKKAGPMTAAPVGKPPVAALQEACQPGEKVLPMSLD